LEEKWLCSTKFKEPGMNNSVAICKKKKKVINHIDLEN
jgi:hypothetical protein